MQETWIAYALFNERVQMFVNVSHMTILIACALPQCERIKCFNGCVGHRVLCVARKHFTFKFKRKHITLEWNPKKNAKCKCTVAYCFRYQFSLSFRSISWRLYCWHPFWVQNLLIHFMTVLRLVGRLYRFGGNKVLWIWSYFNTHSDFFHSPNSHHVFLAQRFFFTNFTLVYERVL